ncbi:MAG: helix-turn-helix domain-containing protein [Ligilactobacillus ruminis]
MTILERIQELARKKDKNLKEISLELGFSKNYLYSLKTQAPSSDKLAKIADYFKVSTDYLLGRPNKQETKKDDVELSDDDVIMTWQGKPLSDEDRELIRRIMNGK